MQTVSNFFIVILCLCSFPSTSAPSNMVIANAPDGLVLLELSLVDGGVGINANINNNNYEGDFIILRSKDQIVWDTILKKPLETEDIYYYDDDPYWGTSYYQANLLTEGQLDVESSGIEEVYFDPGVNYESELHSNVINGNKASIAIFTKNPEKLDLLLFDSNGRMLFHERIEKGQGNTDFDINIPTLSSGYCYLKVTLLSNGKEEIHPLFLR